MFNSPAARCSIPGSRLAAVAVGITLSGVIAHFHPVEGQQTLHVLVNRFHDLPLQSAASDIRLVGRDDETEARLFEFATGFFHARKKDEFLDGCGG